jgi:hypothetical protein
MSPTDTKSGLETMALRPEVLSISTLSTCQCVHPGHPLMRTVLRRGDEDET